MISTGRGSHLTGRSRVTVREWRTEVMLEIEASRTEMAEVVKRGVRKKIY